jgi:hypothetical protein
MKQSLCLVLLVLCPLLTVSAAWFSRLLREGVEQRVEHRLVREGGEHVLWTTPLRTTSAWIKVSPRLLLSGAVGGSLFLATDRLTEPGNPAAPSPFRSPWVYLLVGGVLWVLRNRQKSKTE